VALRVRELLGDEPAGGPAGGGSPVRLRDRLAARFPVRVDPGRRGALAVGAAVLVAAVVTGLWLAADKPRPLAVSATPPAPVGALVGPSSPAASIAAAAGPAAVPSSVAPSSAAEVVVDVAGRVRRPGLYHLPAGARVDDAITAAGGARHGVDLSSLNLAARLIDGQQIAVGRPGAVPGAAVAVGGADPSAASTVAPVDLNAATIDQLETLPGVGPVTAQKILDWRTANGSFTSIDQLRDVSGIGDVRFADLHDLVTV
jgi:competence protein ComEA